MGITINLFKQQSDESAVRAAGPGAATRGGVNLSAGKLLEKTNKTGAAEKAASKKDVVRKQAMKLVTDAWGREKGTEQLKADLAAERKDILNLQKELSVQMDAAGAEMEKLRADSGIDADTREQKDLDLLVKYHDNMRGISRDEFTEEEIDRLKELSGKPLTEYQKSAIQLNRGKQDLKAQLDKNERDLWAIASSETNATIAQVRSQDLQKAQAAADTLMDEADKQVLSLLFAEGKEHIDETAKEQEKKAEEAQEKRDEQAEKIDEARDAQSAERKAEQNAKRREERSAQEEIIKGDRESELLAQNVTGKLAQDDKSSAAQQKIQQILKENNMISEDLKGIEIDLDF